jgi:predicted tellurium resistance membrane protein TerC
VGLLLAMVTRIALLFSLTFIMRLTEPLITVLGEGISGRDMILIAGGLFLLGKSTLEIHGNLEGEAGHQNDQHTSPQVSFMGIIVQIMLLDIVFSLDSVITAIGLTNHLPIMVIAIIIAVIVMIFLAGAIGRFVESHPTVKILALSFLLLIGLALIGEAFEMHIPKGYIYFAMTFSLFVEVLNMKMRKTKITPVKLRKKHSGKV